MPSSSRTFRPPDPVASLMNGSIMALLELMDRSQRWQRDDVEPPVPLSELWNSPDVISFDRANLRRRFRSVLRRVPGRRVWQRPGLRRGHRGPAEGDGGGYGRGAVRGVHGRVGDGPGGAGHAVLASVP